MKQPAANWGTMSCPRPRVWGRPPSLARGRPMTGSGLRPLRILSLLGLVALAVAGIGRTESPGPKSPPAPAAKIEPFTLPTADGKPWTLPDAKQAPLVVVVFTGTACPINTAYFPTLAKLHQ